MTNVRDYVNLRRRAEEVLAGRDKKQNARADEVYDVVEELSLYQIELEIQNEHLVKTQQELQLSNSKYSDLYNFAPVAYFTLNVDGLIVDVNQAALDLLGMNRNSLINRCFSQYIAPEFQLMFSQFRQHVSRELRVHTCELELIKWCGPAFDVLLECKAIHGAEIDHQQFLICVTDITERKQSEQVMQMQRAKLAAIDRMRSINEQVYTLTRKQNHSLTVISNYISGCIRRLESNIFSADELVDTLKKVSLQSTELSGTILQMQASASKSILRYEVSDINSIISDTLALIGFETKEFPVILQYVKSDSLPLVKVDRLHIQQVLLSLARNAIEAMRDVNTLQPRLLVEAQVVDEGVITINMLDNGPGFDPAASAKLFEPNFTTKSYALGLGLGTSRTIIEKHGGELTAHLNASGGANFQFTLPCVAGAH